MSVELRPAAREDLPEIWRMQREAFRELLEKYRDEETNPATEPFETVLRRFSQPGSQYYLIVAGGERAGVIRVIDRRDGSRKRISPLWIMPEYRRRGFARQAILEAERIHGPDRWSLDTILQEEGNLRLYESLGYRQTGERRRVNERMDLVFYEKD